MNFFQQKLFFVGKIFGGGEFLFEKNLFCQKRFYDENFFRQNFCSKIFFGKFFLMKFFINFTVTVGICLRWSQGPTFKVWSKSGQWQLRYSWYGQMSQGQMLPEQMSLWHLEYVKKGPRNQPLKFGQNRASKSWDIADMDKCRQDKCCMDKCPFDNCLRLSRVNG